MKKIHKILLVFVLLVVAVAVSVISNLPIAKRRRRWEKCFGRSLTSRRMLS